MTPPPDAILDAVPERFAVGQPVPRKEDPALLRGEGRYTDDVNVPGQAYGVFVRSTHAHGILRGIDATAARAMPGILAVITQAELDAGGFTRMNGRKIPTSRDGTPMKQPVQPVLARTKVRYVGDPIVFVVAETLHQARDAAEQVVLDIEPLPCVTSASAGAAPGAPVLFDDVPGNIGLDYQFGDTAATDAAFARAAHVISLEMPSNRIVVAQMEPRGAVGAYDPASERWTLAVGTQGVIGFRDWMADGLGCKPEKIHILSKNVGGSFGMRYVPFPEYYAVLFAARALGRPVKWTDTRSESFVSDAHGRDHEMTASLALDAEGNFLAIRVTGFGNLGAAISNCTWVPPTTNIAQNMLSVYRTPLIDVQTKCVYTNTSPVGPYRGAGRPEGNYYMERLIERAALKTGIDSIELRRRNHVRPDQIPYAAPSDLTYDSGDFGNLLDRTLITADWDGYPARARDSQARGRLRGRGIGQFLEVTGPLGTEQGEIRFDDDGGVTLLTGTHDHGQGHATTFSQLISTKLGVPFDLIRLMQSDSDQLQIGSGTGGSKSLMHTGNALLEASDIVIDKGRAAAAAFLEAAVTDIEFSAGRFSVAGTDRGVGIMDLAARLRTSELAGAPDSLSVHHRHTETHHAFPNGCHICEVEIDPDTGHVQIVRYTMVCDFGTIVNPLIVEGQAQGGAVQGVGQALYENVVFDEAGQPLTGSFMDYCLPRAADAPSFAPMASHPTRALTNALGAKGCGEAGCAGALPAVMNAVVDALKPLGITHIDMPATPERVWQAIQAARQRG